MTKEFVEEMKVKMLAEKARIIDELSRFAHRVKGGEAGEFQAEYEDLGDSEDENAQEIANFSNNLSLESTLEKLLRDTEGALTRLEGGEYGVCKYCSNDISEARLRARPTSSSCIACKKTLTQEL
ncbi:MAG: TraR/DksA family transcriptional regulator [bacterium]|nr:TraR/DksA family transcriptional regulator [bacterium]